MFKIPEVEKLIDRFGSPLYVYDETTLRTRVSEAKDALSAHPNVQFLYACKSNTNPTILKIFQQEGLGLDIVSLGELALALQVGFDRKNILYTSDNITEKEMQVLIQKGIRVNLGSLSQIKRYGKLNSNSSVSGISIRINPDWGAGHHPYTITGGPKSKFGIYTDQLEELQSHAEEFQLKIQGLHCHIGSGILNTEDFLKGVEITLKIAESLPNLNFINLGGGWGVPYRPNERALDLHALGFELCKLFEDFNRNYGRELLFYLEPGRFFVAESGVLLVTVVNRKKTPLYQFVGTDSGFNHLIRPMAYGSYHEILNYSNPNGEKEKVVVAGNICESGDIFTQGDDGIEERSIPEVREGDILGILNSGAYGFSMASNYNLQTRPAEVLRTLNGDWKLIRRRETLKDLFATLELE